MKLLLDHGADKDAKTIGGATLFMLAAGAGAEEDARDEQQAIAAAKFVLSLGKINVNAELTANDAKNGPGANVHKKYIFTNEGITASTKMAPGFIFTGQTVYGGEKLKGKSGKGQTHFRNVLSGACGSGTCKCKPIDTCFDKQSAIRQYDKNRNLRSLISNLSRLKKKITKYLSTP